MLDLEPLSLGDPVASTDLSAHRGLDICRQKVEEHEELAHRIFELLAGNPQAEGRGVKRFRGVDDAR